jgi:putative transposase
MPLPLGPNRRWSLDFVHDQMTDGRRLRILTVVDDYARECLALVANTSISGIRVARELDKIVAVRGRRGGDGGGGSRSRAGAQPERGSGLVGR